MAGKDINIPITGEANDFIRSTKDVEKALDKVSDSLDDMARDTKRGGQDAEKAVDKLSDSFDDARKAAKNAGKAGEDAGDDVKRGMKKAEDGVSEFKDEANSTARESAASFDGSAESIGDAFQEIAANAFAGFGPAGAVAGLAAAAGIGLAVAGFEQTAEAQAAAEERISAWADKYIEAGGRIISASQIIAETQAIATNPERYKEASENAKNWGVDVSTAMRAMAGDSTALEAVRRTLGDTEAEVAAKSEEAWAKARNVNSDKQRALQEERVELARGKEAWAALTGEMEAGAERADSVSAALRGMIDDAADATIQVDELGNQVVTLPDDTQIFIDAKTGQASQNIERFKGDLASVPASKAVTVDGTVDLSQVTRGINSYKPPRINIPGRIVDRFGREVI